MIRYSLHGRRVEPDTLVSIHGLAPGWSLQFWNPEKLLEGGYYCVHGSCSSATTSFLFYSIITGNAQFLVPFPYDKSSPVSQARKRRLFQQKNCPVNFCTSLVLVWVIDWLNQFMVWPPVGVCNSEILKNCWKGGITVYMVRAVAPRRLFYFTPL